MAQDILAEALARVEYKLDLVIKFMGMPPSTVPMHFQGQTCPICLKVVDYQINLGKNVVTRRCGCSTGKLPMTVSLIPVDPSGGINGNTAESRSGDGSSSDGDSNPKNRRGR